MDQTAIITKEIQNLILEIRFEKDDSRKVKLQAALKALEWALSPQRHETPSEFL